MRSVVDALMGWRVQGLRQRERILPVGALVTVVGELAHADAPGSYSSFGGPGLKGCVRSGEGRMLVLQACVAVQAFSSCAPPLCVFLRRPPLLQEHASSHAFFSAALRAAGKDVNLT
jgi:hypothetical protein